MKQKKKQLSYKTQEFLELKKEWYAHLKNLGFEDIEEDYKDSSKTCLKRWDSFYFTAKSHGSHTIDLFQSKRDYYYYAYQFLNEAEFETETQKKIWELHAQAISIRDISKYMLENFTLKISRDRVWKILKPLQESLKNFVKARKSIMSKEDILLLRGPKEEDEAFVFATWLQQIASNTRWRNGIDKTQFFKYREIIAAILRKPTITVTVCCLKDDLDIIVGYSVYEKLPTDTILHFVYVRSDWQRQGIARDICPKHITVITHLTKIGERIWSKMVPKPRLISIPLVYEIMETTPQYSEVRTKESENKHGTIQTT